MDLLFGSGQGSGMKAVVFVDTVLQLSLPYWSFQTGVSRGGPLRYGSPSLQAVNATHSYLDPNSM